MLSLNRINRVINKTNFKREISTLSKYIYSNNNNNSLLKSINKSNNNNNNNNVFINKNNNYKVKSFSTTVNTTIDNDSSSSSSSSNTQDENQFKYFHKDVQKVLKDMNINKPTLIQEKTIPTLQNSEDAYVVDETGTGKSFGIMLEIINRYYNDLLENKTTTTNNNNSNIKPKYIIICPTRELSWQFGYWCRNLLNRLFELNSNNNIDKSKLSKVQLAVNGIGSDELLKKELLLSNPDILIGTSNILYPLVVNGFLSIDNLNMLYIDEADQIFQALKKDAIEKQKKIRRDHPLPSSLLFNEIKRRVREKNHLYKESFDDKVINLLKKKKIDNSVNSIDSIENNNGYIRTDRPFQTIFSSATIGNTTKKEIKERDWINVKSQFITALDENKVKSKDIRVNKHGEYLHGSLESAPFREQLSIINRLNHYFINVDSENQLINGVVDVWRNLKPTIAIGILPNDANLTKICETIKKRNINCFTLSHAMNFENFNLIHLPDSIEKDQLIEQSNYEFKQKEYLTKKEIKFREKKKKEILKQLEKQQQQQKQLNENGDNIDDEDENVLEVLKELEKEWKLDQFDNSSVLYLAKEDAIRGIDIEDISHVFILNVDVKPSSYLHMIGRTARMGKFGNVVCIYNSNLSSKYLSTMNQLNIPFKEEDLY